MGTAVMTDPDVSPPQHAPARALRSRGSGSRERANRASYASYASYETGESSTTAASPLANASAHDTLVQRSPDDPLPSSSPSLLRLDAGHDHEGGRREHRVSQRSHKHRSSGAFLLPDALDDGSHDHSRAPTRARRSVLEGHKGKSAANTPEKTRSDRQANAGEGSSSQAAGSRPNGGVPKPALPENSKVTPGDQNGAQDSTAAGSPPAGGPGVTFDMDSAQIVNMALNLSESRRLAARRNVSQPIPPRLAPLPDNTVGCSIRQQLQQQRRISRTISPKPERGPRVVSGQRVTSPLQPAFDSLLDGSYRYHFSQSTLARAQKAKDHLELLGQYRRILELIPPLKPTPSAQAATASPPSSPTQASKAPYAGGGELVANLGRPYNPLQYIRNRKVRARERKAIDGEEQGFGDVLKVTDWVDEVAKWAATGQSRTPGNTLLPPFPDADGSLQQNSPPSALRSSAAVVVSRPKIPRVDWVIDPADMLADIYWLEQGDNKKLVEDRHWRRVFPQDPELYRPLSRQAEDAVPASSRLGLLKDSEAEATAGDSFLELKPAPHKAEHGHVLGSTRERTRQKLHDLRGLRHRHNTSVHSGHDFVRVRKGSASDSSDTEGEPKKRGRRTGTISASERDILEKQMLEMISRENRNHQISSLHEPETERHKPAPYNLMTPERVKAAVDSPAPTRGHSRQGSRVDSDDASASARGGPAGMLESPPKSGRASLEVPSIGRRFSLDYDSSRPTSPELRPTRRDAGFVPAIGADLSPAPSRGASPARKPLPLNKVKSIFRDSSRERGGDRPSIERDVVTESELSQLEPNLDTRPPRQVQVRTSSRSPVRKTITAESHKSHKSIGSISSIGSIRHRGEESGSGFRSLFRGGQRIDTVLRSGVSKVSDLLWRKDSSAEAADMQSSSSSSEESEAEASARGRTRASAVPSRAPSRRRGREEAVKQASKHYLDVMPSFLGQGKSVTSERSSLLSPPSISRTPSRRGSRFDLLKPPQIDVQAASPSSTPPRQVQGARDSDISDTDSRLGGHNDGGYKAAGDRLNAVLALPPPFQAPGIGGHHWAMSSSKTAQSPARAPLSRREVARLRAMMLSSTVLANELTRKATQSRPLASCPRMRKQPKRLTSSGGDTSDESDAAATAAAAVPDGSTTSAAAANNSSSSSNDVISWAEIARFSPDPQELLSRRPVSQAEVYPLAAHVLAASIQQSGQAWQAAADDFAARTAPALRRRLDDLRTRVAGDLSGLTRAAADEADDVSRDLVVSQRLKVRRAVDTIEKLLRRRRRRFRWVRRAGWLAVEWVLVGFMWYVWFVVMIARVFLGIGNGVLAGVRWLLWL